LRNRLKWWGFILVLMLGVVGPTKMVRAVTTQQTQVGVTITKSDADADQLQQSNHQIPSGTQNQSAADTIGTHSQASKPANWSKAVQAAAVNLRHGRLPQTAEVSAGLMVMLGGLLLICWLLGLVIVWQRRQSREERDNQ